MLPIRCHVRLVIAAERLEWLLKHFHVVLENEHQKINESVQEQYELMASAPPTHTWSCKESQPKHQWWHRLIA